MVSFLTQPLPFYLLLPPPSSPLRPTLPLSISLSSSFLSSSPKSSRDLEKANHRASNMSCNGCRVLRKGCSENCTLRTSLQWIQSPESQGHATLFVAKFFGRADLMSFISAVPHHQRPALFQSLLFEACGRTVNPVNGAVGLLCSGNWHICQAAVQTVLSGGVLRPIAPEVLARVLSTAGDSSSAFRSPAAAAPPAGYDRPRAACGKSSGFGGSSVHFQAVADLSLSLVGRGRETTSFESEVSEDCFENGDNGGRRQEVKLLNLFV